MSRGNLKHSIRLRLLRRFAPRNEMRMKLRAMKRERLQVFYILQSKYYLLFKEVEAYEYRDKRKSISNPNTNMDDCQELANNRYDTHRNNYQDNSRITIIEEVCD